MTGAVSLGLMKQDLDKTAEAASAAAEDRTCPAPGQEGQQGVSGSGSGSSYLKASQGMGFKSHLLQAGSWAGLFLFFNF